MRALPAILVCLGLAGVAGAAWGQDFELPAGDASAEDAAEEAPPAPAPPAPNLAPAPAPPAPAPPASPERPTVLVVVHAATPALAARATALNPRATRSLARRLDAVPRDLDVALDPELPRTRAREIAEARAEVLAGIEAFEMLDLEQAVEVLADAVEALIAHMPHLDAAGRDALARGLFALATTVLFDGDTARADSTLVALAAIEPGFQPQPGRYPSNVLDRFERTRGHLSGGETASLRISTRPAGAEVFVDGGARGVTPLVVEGLAPGRHAVTLLAPGHRPEGRLVLVGGDADGRMDLSLGVGAGAAVVPGLSREAVVDPVQARREARAFHADRVALIWLSGSPEAPIADGTWVDRRADRVLARVEHRPLGADLDGAAARLAVAIAGAAPYDPAAVPAPSTEASSQVALTDQWWFWVAVGSVVAAAAATSGVVLARRDGDGPPRNTAIFRF